MRKFESGMNGGMGDGSAVSKIKAAPPAPKLDIRTGAKNDLKPGEKIAYITSLPEPVWRRRDEEYAYSEAKIEFRPLETLYYQDASTCGVRKGHQCCIRPKDHQGLHMGGYGYWRE